MIEAARAWLAQIPRELEWADAAWAEGNAGKGRVCSRRAAGMALKAWIIVFDKDGYGKNFMHHLNAMADDEALEPGLRECAARLAARPRPAEGFRVAIDARRTPMDDARVIEAWCRAEAER